MTGGRSERARLVRLLRERGIVVPSVLDAIGSIPREEFIEEALRVRAYADTSLPIGSDQTISQPWIVARMTELLEPDGKSRVLEIGTGSGYHAAVLAKCFGLVYTVERIPELSRQALKQLRAVGVENVHTKIFDGSYGWSEFAPYHGIVVTAAAPDVPQPLLEQLADGGHLVAPIGELQRAQTLVRVTRRGERFERSEHGLCRFVPLRGRYGWT